MSLKPTDKVRVMTAAVAAAVALLGCQYALWLLSPWSVSSVESASTDGDLVSTLAAHHDTEGVYQFPGQNDVDPESRHDRRNWLAEARRGPFGYVVMRPEGVDPMAIGIPIRGFVMYVAMFFPLAWMLRSYAPRKFVVRWGIVIGVGVAAAIGSYGHMWNWLFFPSRFVFLQAGEMVLGWSVAGMVLARFT